MNGMIFRRVMNSGGQITLPKCVMRECGIERGNELDIITLQSGDGFLVKKPYNRCNICGERTNLQSNAHLSLCLKCLSGFEKEEILHESDLA